MYNAWRVCDWRVQGDACAREGKADMTPDLSQADQRACGARPLRIPYI